MRISASLYSNKNKPLSSLVEELDRCHIDYFHIDCNDDPKVFDDIAQVREISKTPIDLHIISDTPEKYFPLIEKHQPELVTFQYENLPQQVHFPKINQVSYGLAVVSDTSVEVFEDYADQCDFVLIMTTTPGQSGGKFREDNFQKIRKFRKLFPNHKVRVDGGVNAEVGFILRMLGVTSVVSGSFLVNHESIGEALLHLRSSIIHSDFHVKDFMMVKEDAPIINHSDATVPTIIQKIDEGNLGFCILTDSAGKLIGMSSNADVRKGLLKHLEDFNQMKPNEIINQNPVTISEEATISEMLKLIQSKNFTISYLPVINSNHELTGVLTFFNLIKSES